jgi:c-di-GMP-binding flagellar brake protein YcgR
MTDEILTVGDRIDLIRSSLLNRKENERKYYKSQLLDIKDETTILISMPIEEMKLVVLDVGEKYDLWFYTKKGLYQCKTQITDRFKIRSIAVAETVFISDLEKLQRRQFFRLNCVLDFRYRGMESDKWNEGIIIDISGGGAKFNTKNMLNKDSSIMIELTLPHDSQLHSVTAFAPKYDKYEIQAKVISSVPIVGRENSFENRIEFENIDNKQREMIVRFIFEQDRQRRAKV